MPFDTSVLDAALKQRQTGEERERQRLLAELLHLLEKLGPDYKLGEAYVFGSLVKPGRFKSGSDVDIAVGEMSAKDFFRFSSELSTRLRRDVDLIDLSRCPFLEKIKQEGIEWTPSA